MKSYLDNLRPFEKRVVVAGAALFFVVFNLVFVRPYFSQWGAVQERMFQAQRKLGMYNGEIGEMPKYKMWVEQLTAGGGSAVPADDQAHNFSVTVQSQAAASNVHISQTSRIGSHTNATFLEQNQTISINSGEQQLVDFLYNLGASNSLIRVRALNLGPEPAHHELAGSITLVASYQKTTSAKPASGGAKPAGTAAAANPPSPAPPLAATQSSPNKQSGFHPLPYIPGREPQKAKSP